MFPAPLPVRCVKESPRVGARNCELPADDNSFAAARGDGKGMQAWIEGMGGGGGGRCKTEWREE